jgi:hypothetical protein
MRAAKISSWRLLSQCAVLDGVLDPERTIQIVRHAVLQK